MISLKKYLDMEDGSICNRARPKGAVVGHLGIL